MVNTTTSDASLLPRSDEAAGVASRKNTAAAVGICEIVPDAIIASFRLTLAKPEVRSCDQFWVEFFAEPIESVHDWVALIVMARPPVAACIEEDLNAL